MRRTRCFLTVVLLLAAGTSLRAQGQTYTIKLDRPHAVGDRFTIRTHYTAHQTVTATAKGMPAVNQDSLFTVDLSADARVKDASEGLLELTITRCVRFQGLDSSILVKPGSQFLYRSQADDNRLTPQGFEMDESTLGTLNDAFPGVMRNVSDESIGTSKPQRVGASWKIDPDVVALHITNNQSFKVRGKDLKAVGHLVSVDTKAAVPVMTVAADVAVKKFDMPQLQGFKVKSSEASIAISGTLPLDESKGAVATKLEMSIAVTATGKPDESMPTIALNMMYFRSSETTYSYEQ
ncbi:MAG: hypothetical protein JST22_11600 [Bacteroidetes bacterium]|nr:hypothetical protein [Bacteroidota bacterium]